MAEASLPGKSAEHFWGCAIFSTSLTFLYLASTLFHRYGTYFTFDEVESAVITRAVMTRVIHGDRALIYRRRVSSLGKKNKRIHGLSDVFVLPIIGRLSSCPDGGATFAINVDEGPHVKVNAAMI